jgi:hypothetical protein
MREFLSFSTFLTRIRTSQPASYNGRENHPRTLREGSQRREKRIRQALVYKRAAKIDYGEAEITINLLCGVKIKNNYWYAEIFIC